MRTFKFTECRVRPPSDVGPQVWLSSAVTKYLIFKVLKQDGTVNQKLLGRITRKVPAASKPKNGVSTTDMTIDAASGVWCRVFVPAWVDPVKKLPIVLHMPGGGLVLFCPALKEFDEFCRHMCKMCEAILVSVAYRRAPEHKFPTAYDDALLALEWVLAQGGDDAAADFPADNADFSRVFLAGDCAGANVAHHLAVRAGALNITLAGVILIQPFFGGEERTPSELRYKDGKMIKLSELDWCWQAFLPAGADRDHPACNVLGPKSPDFLPMNVPKLLVIVGGRDPLQDRQIRYAEAMQSAGKDCKLVLYDKAFHGFYVFRCVRATAALHEEVEEFVRPADDKSVAGGSTGMRTPRASGSNFLERLWSW